MCVITKPTFLFYRAFLKEDAYCVKQKSENNVPAS